MQKAIGFEQEPQLDAVGGEVVEVSRCESSAVSAFMPTPPLDSTMRSILVLLDEAVGLVDGGFQLGLDGLDFLGVGAEGLVLFGIQAVVNLFDRVERLLLLGPVLGADGRCP